MTKTWFNSLLFYFIFLFVLVISAQAQVYTPKYSNEFLNIGAGARAMGMANSQAALVSDATAGYWNPAGIVHLKDQYEASLMHAEYFAGIAKYDYAAFATQLDSNSYVGISAIRFGVDDIPDTRFLFDQDGKLNYDNIRFFSAADYAFLFTYARRNLFIEGLHAGVNAKIIYRKAGSFANAFGFGFDVGAQYKRKEWQFGLLLKDVTTTFNAWFINSGQLEEVFLATGNDIPYNSIELTLPRLTFAVARQFNIGEKIYVLPSIDADITTDGKRNVLIKGNRFSIDPRMGVELAYQNMVFIRGGIGRFQEIKRFDNTTYMVFQPNVGMGIRIKRVQIDYALTNAGGVSDALFSNVFSLSFGVNK